MCETREGVFSGNFLALSARGHCSVSIQSLNDLCVPQRSHKIRQRVLGFVRYYACI